MEDTICSDCVEEIADLKEKLRIAIIQAEEYQSWALKAERQNDVLLEILESLTHGVFNANLWRLNKKG